MRGQFEELEQQLLLVVREVHLDVLHAEAKLVDGHVPELAVVHGPEVGAKVPEAVDALRGDDPVPNLVHEAPGLHVRQRVRLEVEKSVRELLGGEVLGGVPIVAVE